MKSEITSCIVIKTSVKVKVSSSVNILWKKISKSLYLEENSFFSSWLLDADLLLQYNRSIRIAKTRIVTAIDTEIVVTGFSSAADAS